jgi:hypothetical protein
MSPPKNKSCLPRSSIASDTPHSRLWVGRRPVAQYVAGDARWAGHPGSPGAGRAKLRLSRGFQRCLAYEVTPQKQIALASVFDRERHASFEALWAEGESPPRNQSFPFPFCRVPPSGLSRGRPSHTKLLISSGGVKIIEIERELCGVHAVWRGHAGSPGSGGASPYLRRGSPRGLFRKNPLQRLFVQPTCPRTTACV